MKVILIQGLLAPYRYPIFEELGATPDWQFEVWFMGKKVKNRIWHEGDIRGYHFKYRFLPGVVLNFSHNDLNPFWINHTILNDIKKAKPHIIIMMGWDSLTSFLVHLYCRILGIKFILFADSTSHEQSWRRTLTRPVVSWHVKNADALIAGGSRSQIYLENLGGDKAKIIISYNTIDIEKYEEQVHMMQPYKQQITKELGLANKHIIFYYGQFIRRKGVDILLDAYSQLKQTHPKASLLLIGDGPYRTQLIEIITSNKLQDVVMLPNPGDEQIAAYYAIANIFVLPSREDVWGLVVNEAMAASLPVIVSDQAGCAPDLVEKGINGYIFPSGDSANLVGKIANILDNTELQKSMSQESHHKIQALSPHLMANKYKEAAMGTLTNHGEKIHFTYAAKKDFISIIIPSYKNDEELEKTLVSLKNQVNAPPHEIIVEQDEHCTGSYQTRNRALLRAQGAYIAFIDAGTIATQDWLRTGYKVIQDKDYVGGPIARESSDHNKSWAKLFGRYREFPVSEFMHDLHFAPTTNLWVKRMVIEQLGGFDGSLHSGGDREFGSRVARSHLFKQKYIQELVVIHPFRTYAELMQKQVRLSQGSQQPRARALILLLLPPLWLLKKPSFQARTITEKWQLFLMTYHLSIIHHWTAIRRDPLHVQ